MLIRLKTKTSTQACQNASLFEDEASSSSPILSTVGTPTYNLVRFCDQLLKCPTGNGHTIIFFSFAKEVLEFEAPFLVASFDIKVTFL